MTKAVILAGGLGARLRSAVPDLPKPMAMVGERPFLEYLMDYWINQGVSKFILSVGYKKDLIINHFGLSYKNIPVAYVVEDEPLGTGGGLVLASQELHEPFLLLNGDTYFEVSFSELKNFHIKNSADWTIALFRANEAGRYGGITIDQSHKISGLSTAKGVAGELANGGVYFIEPSSLDLEKFIAGKKYSLEDEVIKSLIEDGKKILGIKQIAVFLDIGIPKDYFDAQQIICK
jgi:D-glycero-alpha-D-manno-heptose 1-phosphate guanylyltransferase